MLLETLSTANPLPKLSDSDSRGVRTGGGFLTVEEFLAKYGSAAAGGAKSEKEKRRRKRLLKRL